MDDLVKEYLELEIRVLQGLDIKDIINVLNILSDALEKERRIFIFGNGGSGSTASHFQNDFNKALFLKTNKTFKVTCLNDNISTILALANDFGYDEIFKYQLQNIGLAKDDIVIAISGSGNSKNIIKAIEFANNVGALTIGLTGYDGGKLRKLSNVSLNTNINNMEITEDVHLCFEHLLISMFYKKFGRKEYTKDE